MNSLLFGGGRHGRRHRPAQADKIDPKVIKTGLILVVGVLAVVFDTTIVSVALHTLATQLHTSVSTIQWVTTGYLLALGMAVPLSTWGLRRFGGKRLWMFALAVFLVGSIGSSLAWNVDSLIAWRVVQGAGGGLMLPVLTTLIMQAAGGKALGRTVTSIALPALLGPILGPLVGGAILTHLSWRFMFWVNVPFCVVGLVLAARYLPATTPPRLQAELDLPGFALLAPGIAALILGLSNAGSAAGFGHLGRRHPAGDRRRAAARLLPVRAARHGEPLADIRLLARRSVASASAVLFFSGFALYGAMLLLPLYYQEARGATALSAGIMLVPQGIGALLSRSVAGRLTDKIGARPVAVVGFVIVAAAHRPVRLRRPGHQQLAARAVAARPGLRPRRRHHPGHGGRLPRPGQGRRSPTRACSPGRRSRSAAPSAPPSWRSSCGRRRRAPRQPRRRLRRRLLVVGRLHRARRPALAVAAERPARRAHSAYRPAGPGGPAQGPRPRPPEPQRSSVINNQDEISA